MKRWMALLLAAGMLLALAACAGKKNEAGSTPGKEEKNKAPLVGICLPERSSYWEENAQMLTQVLEDLGLQTQLCYADNDIRTQIRQVGDLISSMADCLVVAPVDSLALLEVEEEAGSLNIPLIAYDRLLMDTAAVSGHVTFDYEAIGAAIGEHIVSARQLETAAAEGRSYTIEFFMGSADDNNALLLHTGLMSVLGPYLDSGVLVCATGRVSFEDTYTLRWDAETARQKCAGYLTELYTPEQPLSICCAASDELAQGCIAALTEAGYTQENWPLVTGHGATADALAALEAGKQSMTVRKDTQALAQAAAQMVSTLLQGQMPQSNAPTAGDNHVRQVPTWICDTAVLEAPKPDPAQ